MYNKRLLSKIKMGKSVKPNPYKKDIIVDSMGQWAHPGKNTRIPSSSITMKGVNYPVLGVSNTGQKQMMQPGQEYNFPGADYVDEYPQMKKGGAKKKYTSDIINSTNYLFAEHPLFKKKKQSKKRIYDPKASYYQDGGELPEDYQDFLNYSETAPENRRPDENYVYGNPNDYDHYGMWDALGKPKNFEEALQMNPDWQPDPYDGYYHGFSVNPNTGVFLKSGKPEFKPGDTTWMEVNQHYLSPRSNESNLVFDTDLQRFRYIPKKQDGGENSCEPFHKWDSTLNKCVPFTEEEKANYSLQYMRDWTNSPMHKEMLTTSVGKDAPLGDINKYVDNITNLRLKALNPNIKIEDVDPKEKGVIGEAAPVSSDPYVNNVPVIIRNGNKQTINPKVSTEDDIKNYNTFHTPLYYSQLNNAKFKDATLENFTKDFKSDATFYTNNRPGEHAYVYPHEFSHLSDFGGDLIPISDRNLIKEWQSHYPDYPAAYDKYVLEDAKSLADQYMNKIITKDEYDEKKKDLKTDWYLNNKDKRYYSDKEMYENNFNKFKKQGDYNDDTLTNDLPYDDFIRKNKINFDPVDYKRYVGTNSETRARINAARMYGKAAGIYDPFTEKLTPEKYEELKKLFENQNPNERDVNQLRQLKHLYNDDEILNLINTLSKNNSEVENDIQYGKKGGTLPKAQFGLGKDQSISISPYNLNTYIGASGNDIYNPGYGVIYNNPNLFKKLDVAGTPFELSVSRPYNTDPESLRNKSMNYGNGISFNAYNDPGIQQGPVEYALYNAVAQYVGKDVQNINQSDINKYNAYKALNDISNQYTPGKPIDLAARLSFLGNAFNDQPVRGYATLEGGYNPEAGFWAGSDLGGFGVISNKSPRTYFNKGLTRKNDYAIIPKLGLLAPGFRQKNISNKIQDAEYHRLLEKDLAEGTTLAHGYYNHNVDTNESSPLGGAFTFNIRPELKAQYKPFKKIPGILEGVIGANIDLLSGGKEAMNKISTNINPYARLSYSVPIQEQLDRLKNKARSIELPSKKRYEDYVEENENQPEVDNNLDINITSPEINVQGQGTSFGDCLRRGYYRPCAKCKCVKIPEKINPGGAASQFMKDGGQYNLGDEVDEATMRYLKKLGYTFKEI